MAVRAARARRGVQQQELSNRCKGMSSTGMAAATAAASAVAACVLSAGAMGLNVQQHRPCAASQADLGVCNSRKSRSLAEPPAIGSSMLDMYQNVW